MQFYHMQAWRGRGQTGNEYNSYGHLHPPLLQNYFPAIYIASVIMADSKSPSAKELSKIHKIKEMKEKKLKDEDHKNFQQKDGSVAIRKAEKSKAMRPQWQH